ncbi:MAG: Dabb family protein [Planctomycetaceae bacterium]
MPSVQHMVILKFKPSTPRETIEAIFSELAGLQSLIPGIDRFVGGPYASGEGMHKDFTHGFLMEFESPTARDVYLPHPEHERVKAMIIPCIDDVIAFDFES